MIGHFDTLHEVIDGQFRKRIVEYLGVDIYADSVTHQKDLTNGGGVGVNHRREEFIGPLNEKEMSEATDSATRWDPMELKARCDDWYN